MQAPDKKIEILNAARECFARFGYDKTTLDDIGKLVGLNKTSLYYYYKNKEAIFSDVLAAEMNDATQMFQAKIETLPTCRDRVLAYLRERLRYLKQLSSVHNISMDAARKAQPALALLFKGVLEKECAFIERILQKGVEQGELKTCDTKRVAQAIFTVMDAIKTKAFVGTDARFVDKIDMTAVEEEVVFAIVLILDGLSNYKDSL